MPIYYHSPPRKSNGFSIDDIIKNDDVSKTSNRSVYLPPFTWLPSPTSIYQFQRDSMLQYLRHTSHFTNPEMTAAFFLNSYRKPKRHRTAFTPTQLLKLEDAFEKNHYIVGQERRQLARHLNLSETKIKVWYQNRRTKHKRLINEDGTSSINETDHHNGSEAFDRIIKNDDDDDDDEHSWNNEDNHYHLDFNHREEKSCSD